MDLQAVMEDKNMRREEDCKSIEEIRVCIDELDKSIVHNLGVRKSFVNNATKFKRTEDDVRASDRVESMIQNRRNWASEYGLHPDFVESIFRGIVSYFIGQEIKEWSKEENNSSEILISQAELKDAETILSLQKRAYIQEVELNDNNFNIPPMMQSIESMRHDFTTNTILKAATSGDLIVGSVRAVQIHTICFIGRLIVEPIYQKKGIGRKLLHAIEKYFSAASNFELFTGVKSTRNREFYKNAGYIEAEEYDAPDGTRLIKLRKYRT
jgi:chorismate mutase/predicted N-acetyltransferase YhbS